MVFIVSTNTCFWIGCFINDLENYKKIYKIKERNFCKPLAIFVKGFSYFEKYTDLTEQEIDFIKNYTKPFTILIDKKKCKDMYLLENIKKLPNKDKYKKIAFRVAHNEVHNKLIEENRLFFLTSANKSNTKEIKSMKEIKDTFKKDIEKYNIDIFENDNFIIKTSYNYSDIFEITKNWIKYFRKQI